MKKLLIVSILIISGILTSGQTTYRYSIGLGTYMLNELKDYQQQLLLSIQQLPLESVNKFPPYLYFTGQIESSQKKNIIVGVSGGFYSTGGRNHLADYSGEYSLDIPVRSARAGLLFKFKNAGKNNAAAMLNVLPGVEVGFRYSRVKLEESLRVGTLDPQVETMKLFARTIYIEPSLVYQFSIKESFHGFFSVGFEADFNSKLSLSGNRKQWLINQSGDPVHFNMSGLRISLGIGLTSHPLRSDREPEYDDVYR